MKLFNSILKIALLSVLMIGCNDTTLITEDNNFDITASKVTDENTIAKVNQFLTKGKIGGRFKTNSGEHIDFDISTLQSISREGYSNNAFLVSETEDLANDDVVFQLGIFSTADSINSALIVKSESITKTSLLITYIDLDGKIIQEINIDNEAQTVSFRFDNNNFKSADCGHDTAKCISDMYTELGWGSVSWWVGTALFGAPWAVGTAIGCTYAMCIQ